MGTVAGEVGTESVRIAKTGKPVDGGLLDDGFGKIRYYLYPNLFAVVSDLTQFKGTLAE